MVKNMKETPKEKLDRLVFLAEKENKWARQDIEKKIDKIMVPARKEYDNALKSTMTQFELEVQEVIDKFTKSVESANNEYKEAIKEDVQ